MRRSRYRIGGEGSLAEDALLCRAFLIKRAQGDSGPAHPLHLAIPKQLRRCCSINGLEDYAGLISVYLVCFCCRALKIRGGDMGSSYIRTPMA
jgi:hypothetical protein